MIAEWYFDFVSPFAYICLHRLKAVILRGGRNGMLAHILSQRLVGFQGADAASQIPVDRECDE